LAAGGQAAGLAFDEQSRFRPPASMAELTGILFTRIVVPARGDARE